MTIKTVIDEATHDSGVRNAEHGQGSDDHKLPNDDKRHVDPAQEVMDSNPNLSPPIHPRRD